MAKLIGPLMSIDARGSVGDALTYAKIGKTNYAKQYTVPRNPKSAAQTAHRLGIGFISSLWKTLSVEQKATWNDLGDQLQLPPYHAFLKTNCKRWVTDEAPALALPLVDPFPSHQFVGPPDITAYYTPLTPPYDTLNITLEGVAETSAGEPTVVQIADAPNAVTDPGRLDTVALALPTWTPEGSSSWSTTLPATPAMLALAFPRVRLWNSFGGSTQWFTPS